MAEREASHTHHDRQQRADRKNRVICQGGAQAQHVVLAKFTEGSFKNIADGLDFHASLPLSSPYSPFKKAANGFVTPLTAVRLAPLAQPPRLGASAVRFRVIRTPTVFTPVFPEKMGAL